MKVSARGTIALSTPVLTMSPRARTQKLSIKSSSRVQGLESQIAELRSLFITSENVEDRRRSVSVFVTFSNNPPSNLTTAACR